VKSTKFVEEYENKDQSESEWRCVVHKALYVMYSGLCTGSNGPASGTSSEHVPCTRGADALQPHTQTEWSWHLTYKGKVRTLDKPLQLGSRRRKAK
jgi:hypothetical protein